MKTRFAKVCLNWLLVLVVCSFLAAGCANTIIGRKVVTHQTAFSGNSTNGGFIGFAADGEGIIDAHKRDEYDALINIYSKDFLPPITNDFGITVYTNGTYLITKEGLSDFWQMKQWFKDGKKPN